MAEGRRWEQWMHVGCICQTLDELLRAKGTPRAADEFLPDDLQDLMDER
jgi:hypothetical protein